MCLSDADQQSSTRREPPVEETRTEQRDQSGPSASLQSPLEATECSEQHVQSLQSPSWELTTNSDSMQDSSCVGYLQPACAESPQDFVEVELAWRDGFVFLHRFIVIRNTTNVHEALLDAFKVALTLPILDEIDIVRETSTFGTSPEALTDHAQHWHDYYASVMHTPIKDLLTTDGKLDFRHSRFMPKFSRDHKDAFLELQKTNLDDFEDEQYIQLLDMFLCIGYTNQGGGLPALETSDQRARSPEIIRVPLEHGNLTRIWRQLFRAMWEVMPNEHRDRHFGWHEVLARVGQDFTGFTDLIIVSEVKMQRLICWDIVKRFQYLLVKNVELQSAELYLAGRTLQDAELENLPEVPIRQWASLIRSVAKLPTKLWPGQKGKDLPDQLTRVKYALDETALQQLRLWLEHEQSAALLEADPYRITYRLGMR